MGTLLDIMAVVKKIGDLPLANVDYVGGNNQQPHRVTTKEAGHEKGYHFCRS
jgi:hypothetical protein